MAAEYFYETVLQAGERAGLLSPAMRVLVVAGGRFDRDMLFARGYGDVTISNISATANGADRYAPYAWSWQDAEQLSFPDDSFDVVLVHAGLHHCRSPHRALAEMYRVARVGVVVIEARDSLFMRLAARLGLADEYEIVAVVNNGYQGGGVRNSPIPNYVYRWTERELEKVVRAMDPTGTPQLRFLYDLRLPFDRLTHSRSILKRGVVAALRPVAAIMAKLAPRQGNCFGVLIHKARDASARFPWLTQTGATPTIDTAWCDARFVGRR